MTEPASQSGPAAFAGERVLITGAHGFLGGHLVEVMRRHGIGDDRLFTPSSKAADLRDPAACARVVDGIDVVIHLAAHVGGIALNQERPGELFHDTALMGLLLLEAARVAGVRKIVTIGSTCSYPAATPIPFREESLWDGPSDPVTGPYGFAKKMLLVQGEAYRRQYGLNIVHLIPVNLYGPRDHFEFSVGHVVPSLIRRFLEAVDAGDDVVEVWGSGRATRDFLYVEDAAEAIALAAMRYDGVEPVNLGSGREVKIGEVVGLIAAATGFTGEVRWNADRPEGQARRCVEVTRARELFGFEATTPLEIGIPRTVTWYRHNR